MYQRTIRFHDWSAVQTQKNYRQLVKVGDGYRWAQFTGDVVTPLLRSYCVPFRNTKQEYDSPIGFWVLSESGSMPSAETGIIVHRESVDNKDFRERCANGEIIVAPYSTAFGRATSEVEMDEVSRYVVRMVNTYSSTSNIGNALPAVNFWKDKCPYPFRGAYAGHVDSASNRSFGTYYNIGGTELCPWGLNGVPLVEVVERSSSSFSEITGYTPQYILQEIDRYAMRDYIDDNVVQEVLADANAGDVDALTALAEFPETVQSIIDGFKLLRKGFVDWKKKDLLLHSRSEAMSKAMAKEAWAKYRLRKIKSFPLYKKWKWRPANKNKSFEDYSRERDLYKSRLISQDEYWRRKQGLYRRKAQHELASAFASVELNARYNIQTNIYLLQDIAETVWNYGIEYNRYRKKTISQVEAVFDELFGRGNWEFQGENTETFRAFIKRQYDASNGLKKLSNALMTDIVVTGVELIRLWSIVFDWFFTISGCLKAINWNPKHTQQAACTSLKTEINGILTVKEYFTGQPAQVELVYNGYKRNIINPSASIGIRWDPDFSFIRQLDALAFFWQSQKGTLKSYYSR